MNEKAILFVRGEPAQIGMAVWARHKTLVPAKLLGWTKPQEPSSQGKVHIKYDNPKDGVDGWYNPRVIGGKWKWRDDGGLE